MNRLTHSIGGFIRSHQITSAQFIAYVEGGIDRPFFDKITSYICQNKKIKHQIISMRELPGSAGGKIALLELFKKHKNSKSLLSRKFEKSVVYAFFVDKDSDDFCKKKIKSEHLIYTKTYDLEGHLFCCGDLQRALSDACGLTLQQAQKLIPDQYDWLTNISKNTKAWITLCLISQIKRVNCGCTYDIVSPINPDPSAKPNPIKLEEFKSRLANKLSMKRDDFNSLFISIEDQLEIAIKAKQPLKFFKGKWLTHALQSHLKTRPKPPDTLANSAGEKVVTALLSQVSNNPSCKCASPFTKSIDNLITKL